ncbi:hypothetical protein PQX77_019654 [Marasmius sp. AFHP31]|nr:hypothetical protein PQX77_019654 [Marasmius sp. AFHP31]
MSTFFPSSRNFSINGGHFSHVGGDQHNHYNHASTSSADGQMLITQGESSTTMTVHVNGNQINQIVQQKEKERTKFDDVSGFVELADGGEAKILCSTQFRNVRQGDFCRLRDIGINRYLDCPHILQKHRCSNQCQRKKWKVDRAICLAEVDGSPGKVYTAVSYSGPDARKAFEEDFQMYSRALTSQVAQIYAIDLGSVPSLLLRNELVPLAHFEERLSLFIRLYLHILFWQWKCKAEEVWIDSVRGVICHGPAGPDTRMHMWLRDDNMRLGNLPSTVEFLQEDAVLRFFASRKSREVDWMFIEWMGSLYPDYMPELVNPNAAEVISTLSNTPIAIAACHDQTWDSLGDLLERTLLENGLCRFRLGNGKWFELVWGLDARDAWLLQAWSVFHALGITVKDNLEAFVLTIPRIELSGSPSRLKAKQQRRLQQSIYLFVRPFPRGYLAPNDKRWFQYQTSSLHYWSFREDGDSPLSHETCHYLGLPTALRLTCLFLSSSWTTHAYKTIYGYQQLRGFDPTTVHLAQHIEAYHFVFQPVNDSIRFEELHEEQITGLPEPHVDSNPEDVDNSDDYSLTALFYTGSDDDTYTNSAHISNTHKRKDPHEDSLLSSDARTQDVAEHEFATSLDGGASKGQRIGAGYGPQAKRIKRHDYLHQTPKCLHHKNDTTTYNQAVKNPGEGVRPICPLPRRTMISTDPSHQAYWSTDRETLPAGGTDLMLSASRGLHSFSSASMDPSWADALFSTPPGMATVPFYPAQPLESLSMSQPELVTTSYGDAEAEPGSVYANSTVYSDDPSNATSIGDASEYAGGQGRDPRHLRLPVAGSTMLSDSTCWQLAFNVQRSDVEWFDTGNCTHSSTAPDHSFHHAPTSDTASMVSSSTSSRIATIPFHLVQPVGSLRIYQPELVATCCEGAGAEPGSVYANQSVHSVGSSNVSSISDTSGYAGWSRSRVTPITVTSSSLYNALGSDTPAVGYPLSPTAQTPLHSPSTVEPANG